MGHTRTRRIAKLAGASAVAAASLIAMTAEPASAGVTVRDREYAWSNSGGNKVVADSSKSTTSPGGTSTSNGSASVTSGSARAKGSTETTRVRQTKRWW